MAIMGLNICYQNVMSTYHQNLDQPFLVHNYTLHKKLQLYFSYLQS